ncbi:MAG: biopolymer transporter ExbD [Rhodospirillaceae bacterium]|nr:biopolymer transporter ExbD [Rhodospirillaceae bacterium]
MSAQRHEDAQIDMTPMLDVTFIMLIFFIVTASFVKESGITVERPDAESAQAQQLVSILVAVSPDNEVWMDNGKTDVQAVRANMEKLLAENPQGTVVIQADKRADAGTVIAVMNQIKAAGANATALATSEE